MNHRFIFFDFEIFFQRFYRLHRTEIRHKNKFYEIKKSLNFYYKFNSFV